MDVKTDIRVVDHAITDPEARRSLRRVVAVLSVRTARCRLAEARLKRAKVELIHIHDRLGELMGEPNE